MDDKERLEEIKGRYMEFEYDFNLRKEDIDWLIEQAERVQELEEENERLRALDIATTHELNYVDRVNKRYREALENIVNLDGWLIEPNPFCTIEEAYERCVDEAEKALEGEK